MSSKTSIEELAKAPPFEILGDTARLCRPAGFIAKPVFFLFEHAELLYLSIIAFVKFDFTDYADLAKKSPY